MKRANTSRPHMSWKTMDVNDMKIEDNKFNVVVDKVFVKVYHNKTC